MIYCEKCGRYYNLKTPVSPESAPASSEDWEKKYQELLVKARMDYSQGFDDGRKYGLLEESSKKLQVMINASRQDFSAPELDKNFPPATPLQEALEEVAPIGDIYYIHSDTFKRIRAALAGNGTAAEPEARDGN
jgi:hypothetical protein